ncbi:dienelactone hydrolase family protein [Viridibacterium curvum]|uniref:CocE/NonD family hydrolase n=1 Tax=Viridibacterium curvum TaxID=1101404 RepID=A0ABP9QN41_9RHOO
MRPPWRRLLAACLSCCACSLVAAQDTQNWLNESWVRVPVTVTQANDTPLNSTMQITRYRPEGKGPFPLVIINHGRSTENRDSPPRQRMDYLAAYFVRRGFAVLVPTRVGYGESAFEADPEASGQCRNRNYNAALRPAVEQISATLTYARSQDWIDTRRHWVAGVSVGGIASVAYAATRPEGLEAYINFSGGAGGNPVTRPGEPCQPEKLAAVFESAGSRIQVPGLWLYAQNDRYFSKQHVQSWFARYAQTNQQARLEMLPAVGDDGHTLASAAPQLWRPLLDRFLAKLDVAAPRVASAQSPSGFARIDDVQAVPWISNHMRNAQYPAFLASDRPRAFAIARDGTVGWASTPRDAVAQALKFCQRKTNEACMLYAVDDDVVWAPPATP